MFDSLKVQKGMSKKHQRKKETMRVSSFYSFYETRKEIGRKRIVKL
uniref:Uncharacterized protein n=1 Tax=Marseillevirus sp. TaxID=2809551 RepID=A0AA96ELG7_9VIRU|nr:hypothetical protein MarDSR_501 [Marseillevirus sp.]